jgi:hypothetical protein
MAAALGLCRWGPEFGTRKATKKDSYHSMSRCGNRGDASLGQCSPCTSYGLLLLVLTGEDAYPNELTPLPRILL